MSESRDLDALQCEANDIAARACDLLQSWNKVQTAIESSEEPLSLNLAHYTSIEAIVSMLQTPDGGLRLSDTSTMNDPEEGRATAEGSLISDLLEEEFGMDSWLWNRYGAANVCCFVGIERTSEQPIDAGDDLLFWRLYGNDCRGVSITIPPLMSKELVNSSAVGQVTYADESPLEIEQSMFLTFLIDLEELQIRADDANLWSQICPGVLAACDPLFRQRFLRKRSHYEMEREYRAVAFLSENNAEDSRYSHRGQHVQYGRVRRYVQIPELNCDSILTTGSQITIGSNVPEPDNARDSLLELVKESAKIPSAISIRVSKILYRPL